MIRSRLFAASLLALVWTVGCGGDDDGGPAIDQCANADDMAEIAAIEMLDGGAVADGGPWITQDLTTLTTACVLTPACIQLILDGAGESEISMCIDGCLDMGPAMNVSQGCQDCYIEAVLCANSNCIGQCIADSTAPACLQCIDDNCAVRTDECTGI